MTLYEGDESAPLVVCPGCRKSVKAVRTDYGTRVCMHDRIEATTFTDRGGREYDVQVKRSCPWSSASIEYR